MNYLNFLKTTEDQQYKNMFKQVLPIMNKE